MAKPRIITENVVEPVYQRIVNRPSILREKYVPVPNYIRSAPQITSRKPVMMPTKFTSSTKSRTMNIPGNVINIQPVHKPSLLVQRNLIRVQESKP